MHLDPLKRASEPMSKAGTWSFDVRMALHPPPRSRTYNNPCFASVGEKNLFLPLLYPPQACPLKYQTHPAHPQGQCDNPSRNRSRTLRRNWSELLAQNDQIRAMTAAANTVKSVVSPLSSETIREPRLSDVRELLSATVPWWKTHSP